MKRLGRSSSGKSTYGPKWQPNTEIDDDGGCDSASVVQVSVSHQTGVVQPKGRHEEDNTCKGNWRRSHVSDRHRSMYRAALQGDWVAAEVLLGHDENLAFDEITERGDRALHVAAAMEHKSFVKELVQRMSLSQLQNLHDGRGYTACCYAAMSGVIEIGNAMMTRDLNLFTTARDKNNVTPLHKAVSHANKKMVSFLLKSTELKDLPKQERFDLLLEAIRNGLYEAATKILRKDVALATEVNQQGTALHLLARKSDFPFQKEDSVEIQRLISRNIDPKKAGYWYLTRLLWEEIQRMGQTRTIELITKPSIVHEAAEVGNVELIEMLTSTYPDLVWELDDQGHTIFHIAAFNRQENVFRLIYHMKANKDFIATSQDENGNNILHLVALLNPRSTSESAFEMQRDLMWFKGVKAIVPPSCLEMRNKDGYTPGELFSKEHKILLGKSETWVRNTADSCMLIATLMFTVAFTAAFTVPGGCNQDTGIPLLLRTNWFTCFIIFVALALFGSTLSMTAFWYIMTSNFEQDKFLRIMGFLDSGLVGLLISLVSSILTFMSAYFLLFIGEKAPSVKGVVISVYVIVLVAILFRFKLLVKFDSQDDISTRLSGPGEYFLFGSTAGILKRSWHRVLRGKQLYVTSDLVSHVIFSLKRPQQQVAKSALAQSAHSTVSQSI